MKKFAVLIATWFYSGLIPPPRFVGGMAGTYGSIAALPLCWAVAWMRLYRDTPFPWMIAIMATMILGIWSVPIAEKALGPRRDYRGRVKMRDQNQIVIDEVLGMLIASIPMMFQPRLSVGWFLVILVVFRFFDTVKPFPANIFDRMHTAGSVMFDDFFAGMWTAIIVGALMWWF